MNWADMAIRVRALIRIWANQGMPAIPVWAARMRMGSPYVYGLRKITHTRMGSPYAYGIAHTRMGKIRVWDGTDILVILATALTRIVIVLKVT